MSGRDGMSKVAISARDMQKHRVAATANAARGEAPLVVEGRVLRLRPSFAALVAAEQALGPLFALVERASDGRLSIGETASLFWHLLDLPVDDRPDVAALGDALLRLGLAGTAPILGGILAQIVQGDDRAR